MCDLRAPSTGSITRQDPSVAAKILLSDRGNSAQAWPRRWRDYEFVGVRFTRLLAFSEALCTCAANFGKRFCNVSSTRWAHTYSLERITRPMSRNNIPCRIGRNRPTIPRRMNPQPVNNTNHRLRFRFNSSLPKFGAKIPDAPGLNMSLQPSRSSVPGQMVRQPRSLVDSDDQPHGAEDVHQTKHKKGHRHGRRR